MKKWLSALLCITLLAGCSAPENKMKKAAGVKGETGSFGTPIVDLEMEDGKIKNLNIDEISGDTTKKKMGSDYKLGADAIAPWIDQVKALEMYIMDKGIDAVKMDEAGKATDADLLSSCTITIKGYVDTVKKAQQEAK